MRDGRLNDLAICSECGAVIAWQSQKEHSAWHVKQNVLRREIYVLARQMNFTHDIQEDMIEYMFEGLSDGNEDVAKQLEAIRNDIKVAWTELSEPNQEE